MLGHADLETAVEAGAEIFRRLRAKHPDLKGSLVLCHRGQQTGITANPLDLLVHCPQMVADTPAKHEALRLLSEKKTLSSGANAHLVQQLARKLEGRLKELLFNPETQIEVRFTDLRYRLVWALQQDPLVDPEQTPQTKASIRIVLGSLAALSRRRGAQDP